MREHARSIPPAAKPVLRAGEITIFSGGDAAATLMAPTATDNREMR